MYPNKMDTEKLVRLVRNHRELYDANHINHRNRDVVNSIWRSIAMELNSSDIVCKEKWHIIRSNYMRKRRTQRANGETKSSRPQWKYTDLMNFLIPFIEERSHKKKSAIEDQKGHFKRVSNRHDTEDDNTNEHPSLATDSNLDRMENASDASVIPLDNDDQMGHGDENTGGLKIDCKTEMEDDYDVYDEIIPSDNIDQTHASTASMRESQGPERNIGGGFEPMKLYDDISLRRRSSESNFSQNQPHHSQRNSSSHRLIEEFYVQEVQRASQAESDSDRMFLLSMLPMMKQLSQIDNLDFRVEVQQLLRNKLISSQFRTHSRMN